MGISFFYGALAAAVILFAMISYYRKPGLAGLVIGLATITYSLLFDLVFGYLAGLYYYINPYNSVLYMLLSAVLVYAPLNITYACFLPGNTKQKLVYTSLWIIFMLMFEYISVVTGTVVFTGWEPFPWSIATYIATYSWINLLLLYLNRQGIPVRNPYG